jgi:hypothetical protein
MCKINTLISILKIIIFYSPFILTILVQLLIVPVEIVTFIFKIVPYALAIVILAFYCTQFIFSM